MTNLGGIAAVAVSVPANVVGVTLVQAHMVAGVAALRGYDLTDPRVRNAILVCMLGEDAVKDLLKSGKLPSPPMTLATSPVHSPELDRIISHEVTAELITRTVGRRAVTLVARRVPLIGGAVAGGFVRQVLDRAIDGVGPLPSARKAADAHLVDTTHLRIIPRVSGGFP